MTELEYQEQCLCFTIYPPRHGTRDQSFDGAQLHSLAYSGRTLDSGQVLDFELEYKHNYSPYFILESTQQQQLQQLVPIKPLALRRPLFCLTTEETC